MDYLGMHFRVRSDWEIFEKSHQFFYPESSESGSRHEWLLKQMFQDCLNGASLPPFVLAAYHLLKYVR